MTLRIGGLAGERAGEAITSWSSRIPELPVAGFGFLLHFVWEMLQIPWFAGMLTASHGTVVWLCTRATGGDVAILLAGFWVGSLAAGRHRDWLVAGERLPAAIVILTGVAVTVVFEWLATGTLDRWQYAEAMPVVPALGVGLAPLAQWLLLPPLILWLARRHILGGMTGRGTAHARESGGRP